MAARIRHGESERAHSLARVKAAQPKETTMYPRPAQPKAGEPPAQAGDPKDGETKVAEAQPRPKLPTMEEARAELDANPARTSVLTQSGVLVRE
jgi:hypothetical protein